MNSRIVRADFRGKAERNLAAVSRAVSASFFAAFSGAETGWEKVAFDDG
jgi:hypothetical protein